MAEVQQQLERAVDAVKPRLRGVSHKYGALASVPLGIALVISAPAGRPTLAALIYACALSAVLATSATYHRVDWRRPRARALMRRLDHAMIFVLIGGSYTTFSLVVLEGAFADAVLIGVWAGVLGGIAMHLAWPDAPKWATTSAYVALGWTAALATPEMALRLGPVSVALLTGGGVLYTAGAVIYAAQRPDPRPAVFGYHEVFHALVLLAAAAHLAVVAFYALPAAG